MIPVKNLIKVTGKRFRALMLLVAITGTAWVHAQQCIYTDPDTDQSNNIRNYLMEEASEITNSALCDINSLEDWEAVREQRYNEYMESLGIGEELLKGERSPLNVKVTGVLQKDGYRVEKLYYEALPSLYVPGNLYVPDDIEEPRPGVLYLCGHASTQKVAYQAYARKLAELGFVCLIIETTHHQGEVLGEHHGCYRMGWWHWYSRGYTPAGVEVWNAMRGLDLLSERKEVDADRLGVSGRSGGGIQSWFVAAADERVKVAVPEVGATTFHEQIMPMIIDDHCDCMVTSNTYGRDIHELAGALIAPRSLHIQQGYRDRLTNIEGVRQMYSDLKKIYDYYKVPEKVELLVYFGGHGSTPYSRYEMFSYFVKELMGKEPTPEMIGEVGFNPEQDLSADELRVFEDGPLPDDRTPTIHETFIQLPGKPEIRDKRELESHQRYVLDYLRKHTFGAFPEKPCDMDPHWVFRSVDRDEYGSDIYTFVPEEGWRLRVDIRWKRDPANKEPLLLILKKAGDGHFAAADYAKKLGDHGNVAYINVRGVDDAGWEPGLQWHVRRASAWIGRTIASMQVYDLLRAVEFCRMLPGVDPDQIRIAARDEMGAVTLYAALLDGSIDQVILTDPPATQNQPSRPDGTGPAIEMLKCLRVTDVCQIPALIPETEISFMGNIPDTYQWSGDVRKKLGYSSFSALDK